MLPAIVDAALRVIATSLLLGAVLALLVALATRLLPLRAATRHLLWTTALVATAVMPLAGVGASVARAFAAPATVASSADSLTVQYHVRPVAPRHTTVRPNPQQPRPVIPEVVAKRWPTFNFTLPRVSQALATTLVAVWALGAVLGLGGLLLSVVRVRGLKRRSSPLEAELSDELPWLTDITRSREIYLRLSYEIETPVAIGFRRPVILIPTELATKDGLAAIEPLVVHEYAHLRRHDDWTNLAQRFIERIFWFNPLVWLLGRRIVLEREVAADDAVVDRTGDPKGYATSLWRLAREMRMPEHAVVAPGALLTRKQISLRIERLLAGDRARLRRSPIAAFAVTLAGALAIAVVATSAPAVELPIAPQVPLAPLAAAPPKPPSHPVHASRPSQTTITKIIVVRSSATPELIKVRPLPPLVIVTHPHVAVHETGPANQIAPAKPAAPPLPILPPAASVPPFPSTAAARAWLADAAHARELGRTIASQVQRGLAGVEDNGTIVEHNSSHSFAGQRLTREIVAGCSGCSLRHADLHDLDLHGLKLTGVDFRGANLSGADLSGASLTGCDFGNADLRGANFNGARLSGASVRGARIEGTTLRSFVGACTGCDLRGLDLRGADLHGIALSGTDLHGADLRGANLSGVAFTGVDLSYAHLEGADLTNAHLSGCDLNGTVLSHAKTSGLRLVGSDLDD